MALEIQNHLILLGTDMVFSIGLMELTMKVNGNIIKPKDKEPFGTLKGMYIEDNSRMIWLMASVSILILMARSTRVNLEMTSKRAMAKKNGSMVLNTWVHTRME